MADLYQQASRKESDSRFLKPKGNGLVDVLNNYSWTHSKKEYRDDQPYMIVTEYQLNSSQMLNNLYYLGFQIKDAFNRTQNAPQSNESAVLRASSNALVEGDFNGLYKGLYTVEPTGFNYRFPYFNTSMGGGANTFIEDSAENLFGVTFKTLRGLINPFTFSQFPGYGDEIGRVLLAGAASKETLNSFLDGKIGLLNSQSWSDSAVSEITTSFQLLNTIDVDDIKKNIELKFLLNYQNRPIQKNFFVVGDPCIYRVFVPNVGFLPMAHLSEWKVTGIGKQHYSKEFGVVPEAYQFDLTFKSILNPTTRNMMFNESDPDGKFDYDSFGMPKFETFITKSGRDAGLSGAVTSAQDFLSNIFNPSSAPTPAATPPAPTTGTTP